MPVSITKPTDRCAQPALAADGALRPRDHRYFDRCCGALAAADGQAVGRSGVGRWSSQAARLAITLHASLVGRRKPRPLLGAWSRMPGRSVRARRTCLGSPGACLVVRPVRTHGTCLGCCRACLGSCSGCLVARPIEPHGTCRDVWQWEAIGPPARPTRPCS